MTKEELYYLPASELLKHIQAEKERLIKEKIIKKQKELPPITEEEIPYGLPIDWEWVRLGDLYNVLGGKRLPKGMKFSETPTKYVYLRVADMKNGGIDGNNLQYISKEIHEKIKNYTINKEDLYLTIAGTIGRVGIIPKELDGANLTENACKLSPFSQVINKKFMYYVLNSTYIQEIFLDKQTQSAQPKLAIMRIQTTLIPLPPLEQLSKAKDSLLSHADSQLNYTKKMREALLQEAIRGELVPQDENDEPASILLEKIKVEKERLIKEKVIKKQKELPPITDEEKPYELPKGWEWVRLGEISCVISKGTTPKKKNGQIYTETGVNFLRVENITNKLSLDISNIKYVSEEIHVTELSRSIGENGDVLVSIAGALGRVAIIESHHLPCNMNQAVAFVRLIKSYINIDYIKYAISSKTVQGKLLSQKKVTAQPNLTLENISNTEIPLPPLAEQERIVAKLDELMATCDQLEVKAEEMKNYTSKLFEVSLKEAFMPE